MYKIFIYIYNIILYITDTIMVRILKRNIHRAVNQYRGD